MVRRSADIIRGKKAEHLGTLEAPDQRAAYKAAIEKFDIPLSASPSTGPPMTLCNMRELGVRRLVAHCLNPKCRHQSVFAADDYPTKYPCLLSSLG